MEHLQYPDSARPKVFTNLTEGVSMIRVTSDKFSYKLLHHRVSKTENLGFWGFFMDALCGGHL